MYKISIIARVLNLNIPFYDYSISSILTDSRELVTPHTALFFALKTPKNDGHKYIHELYLQGVRNFVVSSPIEEWSTLHEANFLQVSNTTEALQKVAQWHRSHFKIPIVGITGSEGKTTVKEWLWELVHEQFDTVRSPRSYNSQIGVPLSLWQIQNSTELAIIEAGISHPGEMEALQSIIQPTLGIITSIGSQHRENFDSEEQLCLEKLKLFEHTQVIIFNGDNDLINKVIKDKGWEQKAYTWTQNKQKENKHKLLVNNIEYTSNSTYISYTYKKQKERLRIPFIASKETIENIVNTLLAALFLQVPIQEIKQSIKHIEPIEMRMDVRKAKNNNILINDTQNADIKSLQIALSFLEQRATNQNLKRAIVLHDIYEQKPAKEEYYQQLSSLLEQYKIEKIVAIGSWLHKYQHLLSTKEKVFYKTTKEFINFHSWDNTHHTIILLKGIKNIDFETISTKIEERVHETFMEINLDALVHNFNLHKQLLNPHTKIVCMVKADAYGAGACEVAKTLQHHRCDYLAVATAEEGIQLRKEGITLPIIVLNPEVHGFEMLHQYLLEPEVYNFRILHAFIEKAHQMNILDYPIHLKIDTGMHRLGFTQEDIPHLLHLIQKQKQLRIISIFSHLAASEDWHFDEFTTQQIDTFQNIAKQIEVGYQHTFFKHILNSAGIVRFPGQQLDMVRLGISLYGINASSDISTRNVCTLYSTILQIKHLSKGETVGYGRKGVLSGNTKIATIRIGYADGLDRRLGNGVGYALVRGKKAIFVGNICMDLSMIDVTGIDAKEGDKVEIFGNHIPIVDLANRINTIPYEVLTSVSARVKRVYFKE